MDTEKRHLWHRLEPTASLLTVIVIPFALWWVTTRAEADKIRLEYVRLAMGVLQPSDKEQQPQKELRTWAVQILQDSSPVKLSLEATQALIDGDSNLPAAASYYYEGTYNGPDKPYVINKHDNNGNIISSTVVEPESSKKAK